MIANVDRRQEPRLRYSWDGQMYLKNTRGGTLARMVDLNSKGAAMLLENDRGVTMGDEIEVGLMYPKVVNGSFDIIHNRILGTVYRKEGYNDNMNRIVIQFKEPMADAPAVGNEYLY